MKLAPLDWIIILIFFAVSIAIGLFASRRSGKSFSEYFLAGGQMSWWLLGVSMVATTFAADTPNLVTDIVRKNGVSGNWVWWSFLLTGLLTVFIYAKLWKRCGVLTDLEFYEVRYSGKPAAVLRGFRAVYLGIVFNSIVMAVVILAAIKLSSILLGISPIQTVLIAGTVTVIYTLLGGLRGVILTDCFQFGVAMIGSIWAAVELCQLPKVGGLPNLLVHENVVDKLSLLPDFSDTHAIIPLLIIPLAVQWWSSWYPGAEPGGGGYIAQRMLGAENESDATKATLFFVIAHYAIRPWPWIIVALASLVVFPDLESIRTSFPGVEESIVKDDLAYPAMLTRLPSGLLGVVIASLIAAFMSTISTHLNWGGSYITHDFYRRFISPDASEARLVQIGRLSTIGLMMLASLIALGLGSATEGFGVILQIGAGTGLIYILRWFWWRINAYTEIAGMTASFVVALYFQFVHTALGFAAWESWVQLVVGVAVTTAVWLTVTLLTEPTDNDTLNAFYLKIQPDGPGWAPVRNQLSGHQALADGDQSLSSGIAAMAAATFLVYALLFGTGYLIYGELISALVSFTVGAVALGTLMRLWPKLKIR